MGGEKKAGTLEGRKNGKECLPLKAKQSKAFEKKEDFKQRSRL